MVSSEKNHSLLFEKELAKYVCKFCVGQQNSCPKVICCWAIVGFVREVYANFVWVTIFFPKFVEISSQ